MSPSAPAGLPAFYVPHVRHHRLWKMHGGHSSSPREGGRWSLEGTKGKLGKRNEESEKTWLNKKTQRDLGANKSKWTRKERVTSKEHSSHREVCVLGQQLLVGMEKIQVCTGPCDRSPGRWKTRTSQKIPPLNHIWLLSVLPPSKDCPKALLLISGRKAPCNELGPSSHAKHSSQT